MLARQTIRPCLSLGLAAWALAFSGAAGGAPALEQVAAGVNIDPRQISVSGISSGGFMAHQFHVAHSEHIMGAGIVAGGPYYCARGTILDAVTRCSQFVMLECSALGLDARWCKNSDLAPGNRAEIERVADASFAEAEKQEAAGTISKLANLRNSKVYLFSGAHDNIVPLGVMDALFHFYADTNKGGVAAGNMAYNRTFPARHTMVRDSFDKPAGEVVGQCPLPPAAPPPTDKDAYIDDCEAVAKAGALKNHCLCPPGSAAGAAAAAPCPPRLSTNARSSASSRIFPIPRCRMPRWPERATSSFPSLQGRPAVQAAHCLPRLQAGRHTDYRPGHSGNLFAKFAGYNEWAKPTT
jgi:hypothetical protein